MKMKMRLERLGWSQAELARRLGVSNAKVTGWVNKGEAPQYAIAYLDIAYDLVHLRDLISERLAKTPRS
jgi:transcriptional regulator with XRE-family HTH domain